MNNQYDVIIVGGGASGTAFFFALAKYSNITRLALVEKNEQLGAVNSNAHNNSQTLHTGDIETNYSLDKAKQVKPAAELVLGYTQTLPETERQTIIRSMPKMVLGVGATEVQELTTRFAGLKPIFPSLELIDRVQLETLEPAVLAGRPGTQPIVALYNPEGYAVNFGALAQSLAAQAQIATPDAKILSNHHVQKITHTDTGYTLETNHGLISARVVVFNTDAYSLGFAKQLGYGQEFSLIPIAGTFYFSPEILRGKVYTVQEPRLPFAAVHGDPDLTRPNATRWGPTARFLPVLESRNYRSFWSFLRSSGLHRFSTWRSFAKILLEPIRLTYLAKNILYELPYFGKYFFLPQVQKIVPTLRARDLKRATGYGGMRLQRVDTTTSELLLGEGKIIGDQIIFNMTPSPGASVCLYNAHRDAQKIVEFLGENYTFADAQMLHELSPQAETVQNSDVSLGNCYAS